MDEYYHSLKLLLAMVGISPFKPGWYVKVNRSRVSLLSAMVQSSRTSPEVSTLRKGVD
jgi:hypothetical protein